MLLLTFAVEETLAGLRFGARLYDTDDSGVHVLVATHGPLLRELADEPVEDLMGLLQASERYLALLEYGVEVDGTLANQLF